MKNKSLAVNTLIVYVIILTLWTIAWLAKINVLDKFQFFLSSFGSFLYWTISKILLWVLPSLLLLNVCKRKITQVYQTKDKSWLKWGLLIGTIVALINIFYKLLTRQNIWNFEFSFALFNMVIIAPLLEEFLFRGTMLMLLRESFPFFIANIISSFCFLLIHTIGWYFMGVIETNICNFSVVTIFLLGMIFGYAYKKGNSVKSSIIVHVLNNIT